MPSLDALATPDGYAAALRALHAFHAAWEPAVCARPGARGGGARPGRAPQAATAGARPARAHGIKPSDLRPPAPEIHDTAAALGALYVLEGATLGGRVIHRYVAGPLGLTPERGGAYTRATARPPAPAGRSWARSSTATRPRTARRAWSRAPWPASRRWRHGSPPPGALAPAPSLSAAP